MRRLLLAAAIAGVMATAPAYADDNMRDVTQHELPTHKAFMQLHDTLDVVDDPQHGVTCYVARQSDSHALQMQCIKTK